MQEQKEKSLKKQRFKNTRTPSGSSIDHFISHYKMFKC